MREAFTLIEVMVVLSILAIIAILGYNFFGSTMKEATTTQQAAKLAEHIRIIQDAHSMYVLKTGQVPVLNSTATVQAFKDELADLGILKSWPEPDPKWLTPGGACATDWSPKSGGKDWWLEYANLGGTTATEFTFYMYCISEDLCKRFNELYSTHGSTIPASYYNLEFEGGQVCSSAGLPENKYLIFGLGELN